MSNWRKSGNDKEDLVLNVQLKWFSIINEVIRRQDRFQAMCMVQENRYIGITNARNAVIRNNLADGANIPDTPCTLIIVVQGVRKKV